MNPNAKIRRLPGSVPQWAFEDRVRKVRREIGYTQEEMADALGVGLKAYSSWEAGKNTPADILDISGRLHDLTGIPRQWFIGWMDEPEFTGPGGSVTGLYRKSHNTGATILPFPTRTKETTEAVA